MAAWLAMLAGAGAWAAPVDVGDTTTWTVVGGSPAEQAQVRAIEADLPSALRQTRVTWNVVPAAVLPPDLTAAHTLIAMSRRDHLVDLAIGDLEGRVADWLVEHVPESSIGATELADRLRRRQVVHAAAHRADRDHGWSGDPSWSALSGWGGPTPARTPAETDPLSYATPSGATHRREDFATSVERFVVPGLLPGDLVDRPECLIPSKWRLVRTWLGTDGTATPCATLAEVGLDPDRVEAIDVVFIASSASSAASIAGHTGIAISFAPDARGVPRHRAYTLVAHTGGLSGLKYLASGLTGGWQGGVDEETYRALALRYSVREDRDLHRHRFVLDAAQKQRVLERLDELQQGYHRPYLFFTRNCQQLPEELAEAALGEPIRIPAAYSPDALLGLMDRKGLLAPVQADRLEEISLSTRARAARTLRRRASIRIARGADPEMARALSDLRARDVQRRLTGYEALNDVISGGSVPPAAWPELDRIIAWSSPIEQFDARRREGVHARRIPISDAQRAARAALRQRAREQGVDLGTGSTPDAQLLDAARVDTAAGTPHTSLRRFDLFATARHTDDAWSPWVTITNQRYGSRMGAARRYRLAPGMEAAFLQGEVHVALELPVAVRTRWQLFSMARIKGMRTFGNLGTSFTLLDVAVERRVRTTTNATWFEGGTVLELWQAGRHRHQLLLFAGGAVKTVRDHDTMTGADGVIGVAAPVRARFNLGHPRQALTGLQVQAGWTPVAVIGHTWTEQWARATAQVRIAEVFGVDVAMTAQVGLTEGSPLNDGIVREGRAGLTLEPY